MERQKNCYPLFESGLKHFISKGEGGLVFGGDLTSPQAAHFLFIYGVRIYYYIVHSTPTEPKSVHTRQKLACFYA